MHATARSGLRPALGILGTLEAIRRVVRGAVAAERERLATNTREAVATAGEAMLRADGRDDLDAIADELIVSPAFEVARNKLVELALAVPLSEIGELSARRTPSDEMNASLGAGPAGKLTRELFPLLPVATSIYLQCAALGRDAEPMQPPKLSDLVTDPSLAITVRRLILQSARGDAFALGIFAALESRRCLEPWLSLALVDGWIAGERARIKVAALVVGVLVPDDVLPAHERLDPKSLEAEVRAADEQVSSWAKAAGIASADPYFPFGPPDNGAG